MDENDMSQAAACFRIPRSREPYKLETEASNSDLAAEVSNFTLLSEC